MHQSILLFQVSSIKWEEPLMCHKITLVLDEVHQGDYGNHIGRRALSHKLLRAGYYWSSLMRGITTFVKKYDKFQRHANLNHVPAELIHSLTMIWSFYQWGVKILETFPIYPIHLNFLIIKVDYFMKWIKEEVVSKITT